MGKDRFNFLRDKFINRDNYYIVVITKKCVGCGENYVSYLAAFAEGRSNKEIKRLMSKDPQKYCSKKCFNRVRTKIKYHRRKLRLEEEHIKSYQERKKLYYQTWRKKNRKKHNKQMRDYLKKKKRLGLKKNLF